MALSHHFPSLKHAEYV